MNPAKTDRLVELVLMMKLKSSDECLAKLTCSLVRCMKQKKEEIPDKIADFVIFFFNGLKCDTMLKVDTVLLINEHIQL